jgi:hypothetical protein
MRRLYSKEKNKGRNNMKGDKRRRPKKSWFSLFHRRQNLLRKW